MDLGKLYYWEQDKWIPLPGWALSFLQLGVLLGQHRACKRLIVGLAIPIAAYASSLIAAGIVAARLKDAPRDDEIEDHFQMLSSLATGTHLFYQDGDRRLKGFHDGVDCINGEKRIRVRLESRRGTQARGLSKLLLPKDALRVELASGDYNQLPITQRGRVVVNHPRFVEAFLGLEPGVEATGRSQLNVLLVGQVNRFRHEICDTRFGSRVRPDEPVQEGHLQDILCVRRFAGLGPYRSDIHASRTQVEDEGTPEFVVFAGARGYLEWRHSWPDAHWIVVLDKTSNQFKDAVDLFNQDVYKYGLVEATLDQVPNIPAGVEASILCAGQ
jgi:hypothetical protein